jgi:hypothetical protein
MANRQVAAVDWRVVPPQSVAVRTRALEDALSGLIHRPTAAAGEERGRGSADC